MWVLEARKNAETVWYSVIWEKEKDASNVIDYNIHDEITIDTSSVFNANNDTTTGMATVIPWVNAPKLLMDTSIYEVPEPIPVSVNQTFTWYIWPFYFPEWPTALWLYNFYTNSSTGTRKFVYYDWWSWWQWMKCPYPWTYTFTFISVWTSSRYAYEYDWRIAKWWYPDDILLYNYTRPYNNSRIERTFTATLSKWDIVYLWMNMYKSDATAFGTSESVPLTITKTA